MNDDLMAQLESDPRMQQAVAEIVRDLADDPDLNLQAIEKLINAFEFTLQTPEAYGDMRRSAIASGVMDPEDLPEEFDPAFLAAALLALKIIRQQLAGTAAQGFARGGLSAVARAGRRGDTRLAHITPFEDRLLRAHGGSGSINPRTGLPEYGLGKSLKKLFKKIAPVLPIVLNFVAPGLGTAIGTALGASGTAAGMLGSAIIGGTTSKLGGGNFLQGASLGAMGAGLGSTVGGAANSALGLGLGEAGQAMLGSGLVGGVTGAATGQGFLKGAAQGAMGQALGSQVAGLGGPAMQAAGQQLGNMMATGYDPKSALTGAVLAGLTTSVGNKFKPSEAATSGQGLRPGTGEPGLQALDLDLAPLPDAGLRTTDYRTGQVGFRGPTELGADYSLSGEAAPLAPRGFGAADMGTGVAAPGSQVAPAAGGMNWGKAAKLAPTALMMLSAASTPEQVQTALSQSQSEYFNRPLHSWDWDRLRTEAAAAQQPLGIYIAYNWDKLQGGQYNQPAAEDEEKQGTPPTGRARGGAAYARGGALSQVGYLARGGGSGRADTIPARLSDGEFVVDAETVALLGDGSTQEGARRLDEMRHRVRSHKGKALSKGKFSPNAKSPLAYIKERTA